MKCRAPPGELEEARVLQPVCCRMDDGPGCSEPPRKRVFNYLGILRGEFFQSNFEIKPWSLLRTNDLKLVLSQITCQKRIEFLVF